MTSNLLLVISRFSEAAELEPLQVAGGRPIVIRVGLDQRE